MADPSARCASPVQSSAVTLAVRLPIEAIENVTSRPHIPTARIYAVIVEAVIVEAVIVDAVIVDHAILIPPFGLRRNKEGGPTLREKAEVVKSTTVSITFTRICTNTSSKILSR